MGPTVLTGTLRSPCTVGGTQCSNGDPKVAVHSGCVGLGLPLSWCSVVSFISSVLSQLWLSGLLVICLSFEMGSHYVAPG